MRCTTRNVGGVIAGLLLPLWIGAVALSETAEINGKAVSASSDNPADDSVDAGDATSVDGGIAEASDNSGGVIPLENVDAHRPVAPSMGRDDERPKSRKSPEKKVDWRHDTTARRRPGSYIGAVIGYAMGNAWYRTTQRDLTMDFDVGPVHLQATSVRVGDAFFDWFAVGFQVSILNMPFFIKYDREEPRLGAFGLYLDTTFYPWRGLGLRPSVGLGFSFAQAGPESFELGFGGPANLGFTVSYEFRLMRLLTLGPSVQVSWIAGEDYDAFFLFIGLEFLKWFQTAKG